MLLEVLAGAPDQRVGARRQVRVGVDLPVRMGQGDADFLAPVLEAEHLPDPGQRRQLGGAVGPDVDDGADPVDAQGGEGGIRVAGEAHDLAPPDPGANGHNASPSTQSGRSCSAAAGDSDGKRFSNTTTS